MDHLVTILHEKFKKFPHTKNLSNFVDAFSSNQVGIIRTMNKLTSFIRVDLAHESQV
jgi:hypothetical protein